MRDTVAAKSQVEKLATEAEAQSFGSLAMTATLFAKDCQRGGAVLSQISPEDQMRLSLFRDRIAHGYLNGVSNEDRKIKSFDGEQVIRVKLSRLEQDELFSGEWASGNLANFNGLINRLGPRFEEYVRSLDSYDVPTDVLEQYLLQGYIAIPDAN